MEVLHQKKFEKFQLLRSSIKSNGGSVYLFAVEVGAGGYCFTTVRCCLSGLGVSGNFMNSTLKLILSSLKTSLQIWLSKDYKRWAEKEWIPLIKTVSNVAPLSLLLTAQCASAIVQLWSSFNAVLKNTVTFKK